MEATQSSAGTIESISLVDFMCHQNLVVYFSQGLNVVTGSNGSGKSAIVTALIFVLGGKASLTSRASTFKDLIRQGCRRSIVTVSLRNTGEEAYKPEIYGESIVIERKINSSSVCSYKIRTTRGDVMSVKREEIIAITDHFNIQIENPVSVLNQECSKTFLSNHDSKIKYKLFMQATNLSQVVEDYDSCRILQADIESRLRVKEESLETFHHYLHDLESKIRMASDLEQIDTKLDLLRKKLAWKKVIDLEMEKKNKLFSLEKKRENLIHLLEVEEKARENVTSEETMYQRFLEKASTLENEADALSKEKNICQEKRSQNIEDIQRKMIVIKNLCSEIKNTQSALNALDKKFKVMISSGENALKSHQRECDEKLNLQRTNLGKYQSSLETIRNKVKTSEDELWKCKQELRQLTQKQRRLSDEISTKKERIKSLQNNVNDRLNIYGSFTAALRHQIKATEEKKQFKYTPLGPVGSMIEVIEPKWALAVELCLKQILRAYIVFDYNDKVVLTHLLHRLCRAEEIPTIIISSYQERMYSCKQNRPQSEYPTMLEIIRCTDHNVLNVLMDQASIERVLCIGEVSVARKVMIPRAPRNTYKAFTFEGDEIIPQGDGRARFYSTHQSECKLLGRDPSYVIRTLKKECDDCEHQIHCIDSEIDHVTKRIQDIQDLIAETRVQESEISNEINRTKSDILRLEAQLEELREQSSTTIEKEINELKERIEQLNKNRDASNKELESMRELQKELGEQYLKMKTSVTLIKNGVNDLKKLGVEKMEKLNYLGQTLMSHVSATNKLKQKLKILEDLAKSYDEEIAARTEEALKLGERIEVTETQENLDIDIKQLERAVSTNNTTFSELKKYKDSYAEALKSFDVQSAHIADLQTLNKKLKATLDARIPTYEKLRALVVRRVQSTFEEFLKQRGYKGSLEFDHEQHKLVITVSPNPTVAANEALSIRCTDTRSLSGGERSFSTLSFIVSLWQGMDSPFRCLDEFDVFMDIINRKAGIRLLRDFSRAQCNQQVILITPHDISDLKVFSDVTIFRMDDPR